MARCFMIELATAVGGQVLQIENVGRLNVEWMWNTARGTADGIFVFDWSILAVEGRRNLHPLL